MYILSILCILHYTHTHILVGPSGLARPAPSGSGPPRVLACLVLGCRDDDLIHIYLGGGKGNISMLERERERTLRQAQYHFGTATPPSPAAPRPASRSFRSTILSTRASICWVTAPPSRYAMICFCERARAIS